MLVALDLVVRVDFYEFFFNIHIEWIQSVESENEFLLATNSLSRTFLSFLLLGWIVVQE